MIYFELRNGKFKKLYDIVVCNYYVDSNTIICYEKSGIRWIFTGINCVKVSEDIVFNVYNGRNA